MLHLHFQYWNHVERCLAEKETLWEHCKAHTLRSHSFSCSARGYQGSKFCNVTNGQGGKKWEMYTDEVSPSNQMKDFPNLLWLRWSTWSLPLVWLAEQRVQNEMIITWEIRSILKQVWLPVQQHLNLPAWSKNNSSVDVTNYKMTLTNAGPVTKKLLPATTDCCSGTDSQLPSRLAECKTLAQRWALSLNVTDSSGTNFLCSFPLILSPRSPRRVVSSLQLPIR